MKLVYSDEIVGVDLPATSIGSVYLNNNNPYIRGAGGFLCLTSFRWLSPSEVPKEGWLRKAESELVIQ